MNDNNGQAGRPSCNIRIDARGLSCPMPAMLTRKALFKNDSGRIEVRLDNAASCDNVTRPAEREGWRVEARQLPDGSSLLVLTR